MDDYSNLTSDDKIHLNYFKKEFIKAIEFYKDKRQILDNNYNHYNGNISISGNIYYLFLYDVFAIMHTYEAALINNNITIIVSGDTHAQNFKDTLTKIKGITHMENTKKNYTFKEYFIKIGLLRHDLKNLSILKKHLKTYYTHMIKNNKDKDEIIKILPEMKYIDSIDLL